MKLSHLTVEAFSVGEPANTIYDDSLITDVVFSGSSDNLNNNKWCIVFGNSVQVDERVKTVIQKNHDYELCEVFDEQYDDEQREQHFEVCWIIIPQCEKLYQR